jgi:Glutaredoxin-like domain (DUF836)
MFGRVAACAELRRVRENHGMTHPDGSPPRVTVIGKPGCHLCEEAERVVADVCAQVGEDFDIVSIFDDPLLAGRYAEEIPVVLVDGRQFSFFRVDAERLRSRLTDNRT